MKIPRKIIIMPALNGYVCQVDCQTIVFESRERLIQELDTYLKDPDSTEKLWRKDALHPVPEEILRDGGSPQIDLRGPRAEALLGLTNPTTPMAEQEAPRRLR